VEIPELSEERATNRRPDGVVRYPGGLVLVDGKEAGNVRPQPVNGFEVEFLPASKTVRLACDYTALDLIARHARRGDARS